MGKKTLGKPRKPRSPPKKAPKPRPKGTTPVRLSRVNRAKAHALVLEIEAKFNKNKFLRPIRNKTKNLNRITASADIRVALLKKGVNYAVRTITKIRGLRPVVGRKAPNRTAQKKSRDKMRKYRLELGVGGPETRL